MLFVHSGNEYSAILRNGDVIKFEDEREALAVRKEYEGILEVLGKRLPDKNAEFEITVNPSVSRADSSLYTKEPKKKKLRISIDTDTEFFCIRKALA